MSQMTVASIGTSAESTAGVITFNVHPWMFRNNSKPSLVCSELASTEVVTLYVGDGTGWEPVYDDQATPVAATLDSANNKTSITFNTPGLYSVTNAATGAVRKLKILW